MVKGLEEKIKSLESTKDSLNNKNAELIEEIKQQERKHSSAAIKLEKENNTLRQEISTLQKDQSIKFSEYEKLDKEAAILQSTIEVQD